MSFHKSNSQKIIGISTPTNSSLFKTDFQKMRNKNNVYSLENNKSQTTNYLFFKKSPISLRQKRKNYDNSSIFEKREKVFHKSIEDKKKVFKYQNYSFNENDTVEFVGNKTSKNLNKEYPSFYLTERMIKSNSTFLPNINKKEKISIKNKPQKKILVDNNLLDKIIHRKNLEMNDINPDEKFRVNSINKKEVLLSRNCDIKSIKSFIFNLKDFLTEKHENKIKKEKYKSEKENTKNRYLLLNMEKKFLESNFNQYNSSFMGNFATKFNEYTKQIFLQYEQEQLKDNCLISEIQKLKKAKFAIRIRKNKIQNDRDSLSRWMFLQICVKEKIKKVPSYYKFIVNNAFNLKFDTKGNLEIPNEKISISSEEVNRILNFKKNMIYKDGQSFLNEIKTYENENIELIKYYNLLREEIMLLNQEKENLLNEEKSPNNNELIGVNLEQLISLKYKILNNVKNKNSKLLQDKNLLTINDKENNNNYHHHSKLYIKIKKCCDNLSKYVFYDFKDNMSTKIIQDTSEEKLIVFYVKRFEKLVYIFMKKNLTMKEIYGDDFTNLKSKQEKEKKVRKNYEQKLNLKILLENKMKKLFEKSDKVFFLPLHKINAYNVTGKKLQLKKYKKLKNKKMESIDDYLFDSNDE